MKKPLSKQRSKKARWILRWNKTEDNRKKKALSLSSCNRVHGGMKKAEIQDTLRNLGISFTTKMTKQELIDLHNEGQ